MKVEEFAKLKAKIESLRQRKARAEGALEQSERRLLAKLKAKSVEEAERSLDGLRRKSNSLRNLHREKMAEFEAKWGDKLDS